MSFFGPTCTVCNEPVVDGWCKCNCLVPKMARDSHAACEVLGLSPYAEFIYPVCACCHQEHDHSSIEWRLDQWLMIGEGLETQHAEWRLTLCAAHEVELAAALLRRAAR